jgi:peptidoglycan/LPS O-acetylase OafA/YrhL
MFRNSIQKLQAVHDALLRPFLVNPSSGDPLAHMDGIRAVAVLLVFFFHTWVISGQPALFFTLPVISSTINVTPILSSGFIGVQLFFVLSGFLLAQYWLKPHFQGKPRPSTRQYFKRRFLRLMPAYYCCLFLLLLFFVPALIPVQSVYSLSGILVLGAHLLFLQYLFPASAPSYIVAGSFWTLTMEMLFYLVLPITVWFFLKGRWLYSLFASVLVSLGWLYLTRNSYFLSLQFPDHAANFALGISLANIYVQYQLKIRKDRTFLILTGKRAALVYFFGGWALELFLIYEILPGQNQRFAYYSYSIIASLGFTLILSGILFGNEWIRALFSFTPLRLIGIISYSMYLWHLPLIHLFNSFPGVAIQPPETRFTHVLLKASLAVLILSAGSFLAIEKPFMVLGRKKSSTKSKVLEPPGEAPVALAVSTARDQSSKEPVALAAQAYGTPQINKALAESAKRATNDIRRM